MKICANPDAVPPNAEFAPTVVPLLTGINFTSTEYAPWYIIPADNKWYMRTVVGDIIVHTLESLPLRYPVVSTAKQKEIQLAKEMLENETD